MVGHEDEARPDRDGPTPAVERALDVSHPVSSEGVDLTQIRALRALTPTERVRSLVTTLQNLRRYRAGLRRL